MFLSRLWLMICKVLAILFDGLLSYTIILFIKSFPFHDIVWTFWITQFKKLNSIPYSVDAIMTIIVLVFLRFFFQLFFGRAPAQWILGMKYSVYIQSHFMSRLMRASHEILFLPVFPLEILSLFGLKTLKEKMSFSNLWVDQRLWEKCLRAGLLILLSVLLIIVMPLALHWKNMYPAKKVETKLSKLISKKADYSLFRPYLSNKHGISFFSDLNSGKLILIPGQRGVILLDSKSSSRIEMTLHKGQDLKKATSLFSVSNPLWKYLKKDRKSFQLATDALTASYKELPNYFLQYGPFALWGAVEVRELFYANDKLPMKKVRLLEGPKGKFFIFEEISKDKTEITALVISLTETNFSIKLTGTSKKNVEYGYLSILKSLFSSIKKDSSSIFSMQNFSIFTIEDGLDFKDMKPRDKIKWERLSFVHLRKQVISVLKLKDNFITESYLNAFRAFSKKLESKVGKLYVKKLHSMIEALEKNDPELIR